MRDLYREKNRNLSRNMTPITFVFLFLINFFTLSNAGEVDTWRVFPIIKLDENRNPTRCGYLYELKKNDLVLKVEKFVQSEHVITSLTVITTSLNSGDKVSIKTKSFDSDKEFKTINSTNKIYLSS